MNDLLYRYEGKEYTAQIAVVSEVQLVPTRYRVMVEGYKKQWNMTLITLDLTEGHKEFRRIEQGLLEVAGVYSSDELPDKHLILVVNERGGTFAVASPAYPERVFVLDENKR